VQPDTPGGERETVACIEDWIPPDRRARSSLTVFSSFHSIIDGGGGGGGGGGVGGCVCV